MPLRDTHSALRVEAIAVDLMYIRQMDRHAFLSGFTGAQRARTIRQTSVYISIFRAACSMLTGAKPIASPHGRKSAWRAQTCSTRTWPWLACVLMISLMLQGRTSHDGEVAGRRLMQALKSTKANTPASVQCWLQHALSTVSEAVVGQVADCVHAMHNAQFLCP